MASSPQTVDQSSNAQALVDAVARGDLDHAEAALEAIGQIPATALPAVGELHKQRQRWPLAIQAWEQLKDRDFEINLKLFLCKNLSSMQQSRPDLYARLDPSFDLTRYRFTGSRDGKPMIVDVSDPRRPFVLTPDEDPARAIQHAVTQLDRAMRAGMPLGLVGIGDGYLLNYLAHQPPTLFMDQQQVVYVMEPDPQLLLACMMIHDFSGPNGPIEQPRFQWYVGENWLEQYRRAHLDDPFLPPPVIHVGQSRNKQAATKQLTVVDQSRRHHEQRLKEDLDRHYSAVSDDDLVALFGSNPPRTPRVLLVTSRFTTVLQYSARQAAKGFEHNQWRTKLLIEPSEYHRTPALALLTALDTFRPDLVFVLDHLRTSLGETIPEALPYACWTQDLLPNLINEAAGASVKARDFVLTYSTPRLVDDFGYPARQCIDVPMMMAPMSHRPATWVSDGDDLVYVSNLAGEPDELVAKAVSNAPAELRSFVALCCQQIMQRYEKGSAIPTQYELRIFLRELAEQVGKRLDSNTTQVLVDGLWNPLNIALYRQQALAWVADAAEEFGLRLGLYGRGWDRNRRFCHYDRGVVTPGPDLDALCRRSKINLNLEPYPCVTHSRLLNGLVAGGFFLIREHSSNQIMRRLAQFLNTHLGPSVQDQEQARHAVEASRREVLENLLAAGACLCFSTAPDPIKQVRAYQRAGVLGQDEPLLPRLDDVSFGNPESCRALIEQFVNDEDRRSQIQAEQCRMVEQQLSIGVGINRIIHRIGRIIAQNANSTSEMQEART